MKDPKTKLPKDVKTLLIVIFCVVIFATYVLTLPPTPFDSNSDKLVINLNYPITNAETTTQYDPNIDVTVPSTTVPPVTEPTTTEPTTQPTTEPTTQPSTQPSTTTPSTEEESKCCLCGIFDFAACVCHTAGDAIEFVGSLFC